MKDLGGLIHYEFKRFDKFIYIYIYKVPFVYILIYNGLDSRWTVSK